VRDAFWNSKAESRWLGRQVNREWGDVLLGYEAGTAAFLGAFR